MWARKNSFQAVSSWNSMLRSMPKTCTHLRQICNHARHVEKQAGSGPVSAFLANVHCYTSVQRLFMRGIWTTQHPRYHSCRRHLPMLLHHRESLAWSPSYTAVCKFFQNSVDDERLHNYVVDGRPASHNNHVTDVTVTDSGRDVKLEPLPEGPKVAGTMYARIMKLEWPELLATIQHYHDKLDKTHYALAMKRLHKIAVFMDYEEFVVYRDRVKKQPGFKLLCALLALKGQYLEGEVAADMLLFLHEFDLDSRDPTMQVYLHLIRQHLSDLPLDQLVKVAYAVNAMTTTPNCQLILQGILTLLPYKMSKIAFLDVHEQVQLLYVYGPQLSREHLGKLMRKIEYDLDLLPESYVHPLLRAYERINLKSDLIENFCCWKIARHVPYMTADEICEVLHTCHQVGIYDPDLVNEVTSRSLELDWRDLLAVMMSLLDMNVYKESMLKQLVEDVTKAENMYAVSLTEACDILRLLVDASHQWSGGDLHILTGQLLHTIEDGSHLLPVVTLVELFGSLHILGCSSDILLEELCSRPSEDVEEVLQSCMELPQTLPSWSSTCLAHPAYRLKCALKTGSYSPDQRLTQLISSITGSIEKMRSAIHGMLYMVADGCEIQDNGCSADSFVYDHLVLLDDGPAELQQRVAFLVLDSMCFHRNTAQLRGHAAYHAKQLQEEGYLVSVVNQSSYMKIRDHDRVGYIERKLEKVKDDQSLAMMSLDWK